MKKLLFFLISLSSVQMQYSKFADTIAKLPIAFSVVREDPSHDLEIIKKYFPDDKISMLMVASGGCTAAHLVANASINDLTLIDPNKSQLELAKLKINLLMLPTDKRLEILGYKDLKPNIRKEIMLGYSKALDIDLDAFGDIDTIAKYGIDFSGRYEKVFEKVREHMEKHQADLEKLFTFDTVEQQVEFLNPHKPLGKALDKALDYVMSQKNLVKIFGEKATANRVQDFSKHFAQQIRNYLTHHRAKDSAWLANMLLGRFIDDVMLDWLNSSLTTKLPTITYKNEYMNQVLEKAKPESFHVIHLSNIIDWLTPQEAEKTLQLAYRALKPGGLITIRQLNSNIEINKLNTDFAWNRKLGNELLHNDRSFFYRNFLIGVKTRASTAPKVQAAADMILKETGITTGSFFKNLPTMSKQQFQKIQSQFFFAVDHFSLPMSALISRLTLHKDRINILHNIVEEHGDFSSDNYHSTSFKKFLERIDIPKETVENITISPVVNMFNTTLMGVCSHQDTITAIACMGIIEYAFADISQMIGTQTVNRNWIEKNNLIHYNLHAEIDKQHAEDFFKIIEHHMNTKDKEKVFAGLRLGAYIFNRLYEDLYKETI